MNPSILILVIAIYFILILAVSYFTGKNNSNETFFTGNRQSKWYLVSFGMIGASLSGVTFISVPDWVQSSQFSYLQMVMGYLAGYLIIANVLLPVYYRLKLTSIYGYLEDRFGRVSYKTGAWCFLVSRTIGASFRLYLVAKVLQTTIASHYNISFSVTVGITIVLIWLYTFRGGIKTVVYTDVVQTFFMLLAVILTIVFIGKSLGLDLKGIVTTINESEMSKTFFFDNFKSNGKHFIKQFFSGILIAVSMTGLDQDMMQKNLTCRNLREAKKNIYWYGSAFLPINVLFLSLGILLFQFAQANGITLSSSADTLYPVVATSGYLPGIITIAFMLGLIAAAYSSADSALTSLTTSFTLDILNGNKKKEKELMVLRKKVHVLMSVVLFIIILLFKVYNNDNVIAALFKAAGYTYGPLLGMFLFGLITPWNIKDKYIYIVIMLSPILTYVFNLYSVQLFNGYVFSFEILFLNALLTFMGMCVIIMRNKRG